MNKLPWYQSNGFRLSIYFIATIAVIFSHFFMPRFDYYVIWASVIMFPFALILSLTGASIRWIILLPVPNIVMTVGMVATNHDFSQPLLYALLGILGGGFIMCICLLLTENKVFKVLSLASFSVMLFIFIPRWTSNLFMTMDNIFDLATYSTRAVRADTIYSLQYYKINGRDSFNLRKSDKKLLLEIWRLSCKPCITELPDLYEMIKHNPYPEHYEIYSLLIPDSKQDTLADADIRKVLKYSHPHFIFTKDTEAANKIGIRAVPQFILLDSNGKVLETGLASNYKYYENNLQSVMKRWKDF